MSFDNLIQWLKDPSLLDKDSLSQLRALVDEYPCFTAARILYLKNLLALNDLRFSKELILTAISVPDRRRLYYFIEDKPMPESLYSHEKELTAGEGFSIIDRFLHLNEKETPLVEMSVEGEFADSVEAPEEEDLLLDLNTEPFDLSDLSQNESSFSLDYVSFLKQTSPDEESVAQTMNGQDLIDAFLEESPEGESKTIRLKSKTPENSEKTEKVVLDVPSSLDAELTVVDLPEDTFTETLAKIYLKQKRYEHALEIFKSLSLKYPEKNVYFADQIRFLEKLIINIKNN